MDKGHLKQYLVGIAVALTFTMCGMVYGWSAPTMVRLLSNESDIPMTEEEGSYVIPAVEFGSILTSLPAGFIADKFGSKKVILSIIPMYISGWTLIIVTRSLEVLILARIIFGMAMGIVLTICPLYLGEIAEPEIRGKVTSFCSVLWFTGILTSYCIGPYVSYETLSYISVSLPIALSFVLIFIPESPYNLLSKGKTEAAKKELRKIRSGSYASIEKEIKSIKNALEENNGEKMTCKSLLMDPCCRMSLFLVLLLGIVILLGGVTVMYAYATEIFQTVGGVPLNADQCTIFLGFLYCILTIIATTIVDVFGRRPLFLISAGGAAICHFMGGLYFYLQYHTSVEVSSQGWMLLVAVGGYCVFCSIGINPLTPVYQGEIFPEGIKGVASGIFNLEQSVLSMTALKLFQVFNSNFGKHMSFWFFSMVNVIGFILMYFYLIETKGKTLSEIQRELKNPLKKKEVIVDLNETVPFKLYS